MNLSRASFYLLVASAVSSGCGASNQTRHANEFTDGGEDGGQHAAGGSGAGGGANGTSDGGSPPADAGPSPADGSASPSVDASADRSVDASVDSSVGTDGSTPTDSGSPGPVLGEYCEFASPDLENQIRGYLSNQNIDGGVPSGPIRVALASRVKSLELFCDCNDTLDLGGAECLTGLQSVTIGQDLDHFGALAFLPDLTDIEFEYLSDLPAELSSLIHLRTITTHITSFSDLTVLADMPFLQDLQLSDNQLVDLAPFSKVTNLETLNVSGNQIVSLAPLAGLKKLRNLTAGYNPITSLAPLAGLTSLGTLDLSSVPGLKDLSPLVANSGIGAGDQVALTLNAADCASFKADAKTLTDRGVILSGVPICP